MLLFTVVVVALKSVPAFPTKLTVAPDWKFVPVITKSNPAVICASVGLVLFTEVTLGETSIDIKLPALFLPSNFPVVELNLNWPAVYFLLHQYLN